MMSANLHALPLALGVPKTCCRCGQGFQDFSDRGLARMCTECRKPKAKPPRYPPTLLGKPLTARETQVMDLVAAGKLNKEIGGMLHLGEGTVKVAISRILAKTGMTNRTALAVWWVPQGLECFSRRTMPHAWVCASCGVEYAPGDHDATLCVWRQEQRRLYEHDREEAAGRYRLGPCHH